VVERVPFARRALNWRGFRCGPKSLVDVGHTGKCCEGFVGASAKQELKSQSGHTLPSSLPQLL